MSFGQKQYILTVVFSDPGRAEKNPSMEFRYLLNEFQKKIKEVSVGNNKSLYIAVSDLSDGNIC